MSAVESVQGPLLSTSLVGEPNQVDGEGVNMAVGKCLRTQRYDHSF